MKQKWIKPINLVVLQILVKKSKLRSKEDKSKKQNAFDSVRACYERRELTLNTCRNGIFPVK